MKLWQFGLVCVAAMAMSLLATHGWADPVTPAGDTVSNGTVGCVMAKNLYSGTLGLIQGPVGLLIGLVMLLAGFWALINGAAILPSLGTIIMGGLVTALPSLINSAFDGIGTAMSGGMGGVPYNTDLPCQTTAVAPGVCDGAKGDEICNTSNKTIYFYGGNVVQ